ncbi:MAG: radical SAM protein [Oscillospiraceae bacterium]|jgi:MoaA/NifB/PqqE/SkfB family radical SAM enzyme|nr:radical SAM protein [Oscillospiraceae bacterium]
MSQNYKTIISWTLTHKCQEKCGYCFSPRPSCELGESEHYIIQSKLIESKTHGNYYIGGEALLVPHLIKLIVSAYEAGIDTRLSTNGILLTPEKFQTLKLYLNQIALPFDSLDDNINYIIGRNKSHRSTISTRIKMIK